MGEQNNVEAKKPARQRIKEASVELFKDGGRVARAAFWAVTGIYSETLRIEGILRGVDGRVEGVEKKADVAGTKIGQIGEAQTAQAKEIGEIKLTASNAKGAAADAKTEVGQLGKKVAAVEEANAKQDIKIEELTTGWGRVDKILAALGGEKIAETVARMVQEAVEKLGLKAPAAIQVPTGVSEKVLTERLAALKAEIMVVVEPAIVFEEACAQDLSVGVRDMQVEEALKSGDFTKVLKGFDPKEVRENIDKLAEDEGSDARKTAKSITVEGSPIAQAFAKAVVTWVTEHVEAEEGEFKDVVTEALDAIGSNEAFGEAVSALIASDGEIADAATKTKERISTITW